MSWLFFLHLPQYNKEEIWCPIFSRPQCKAYDFCLLPSCTFIITSFSAAWILRSQSFQTHRKCQLFYLSAVSLRVHTSSEPLSASIRFSRSAVRLLLSLLSDTDGGAHRIMVEKTNGGFTSRMLHLRDFLLHFFCSYSSFNAAVCWKKKTHTKEREGQKKSFCVFTSHPVSEEAEEKEEEEEEGNEPPECLTSEPGGHAHKSPMKGTTEGRSGFYINVM